MPTRNTAGLLPHRPAWHPSSCENGSGRMMAGTRGGPELPPSFGEKQMTPYLMGEDELPELEAPAPAPGPFPGYPPPPGLVVCCSHAASASSVETPIATKRWRSFMATPFLSLRGESDSIAPITAVPPRVRADRPTRSMQSE